MAALNCWNCNSTVEAPLPLSRREVCPSCDADMRCCRMCDFYDRGYARDCREPVADAVADKERSNMCDFFRPGVPGAAADGGASAEARKKLERLFGGEDGETASTSDGSGGGSLETEAEAARRKLEQMFKKD